MGCCSSDENTQEINTRMKEGRSRDIKEQKLLLLGTGESGKSTIFKNLKRIQGEDMVDQLTLQGIQYSIRQNIVEFMVKLLQKSQAFYLVDNVKHGDCKIEETEEMIKHAKFLLENQKTSFPEDLKENDDTPINLGKAIAYLWQLPGIKATFAKRCGRFSFPDNLEFFFDKAVEVMKSDYKPTDEDIIKVRVRTTGFVTYTYTEEKVSFLITDVGGQRSERKKWLSYFDNVAGVIFVTALNHYNAVLFEDEDKNAMHEAVQLFQQYANIQQFQHAEMILFLNKRDLFEEQLRTVPLGVCFSTAAGWKNEQWQGKDYTPIKDNPVADKNHFDECNQQAIEFIKQLFVSRNTIQDRSVVCHVTCATDQGNVKAVFWDVQKKIIEINLKYGGFLG